MKSLFKLNVKLCTFLLIKICININYANIHFEIIFCTNNII